MVVRFVVAAFLALVFWMWLALPICGCSTREGAYAAAMKSDLKNLASQQEIHFAEHESYSDRVQALAFTNSDGVLVDIQLIDSGAAWSARATHVVNTNPEYDRYGEDCVVYGGSVDPRPQTTTRKSEPVEAGTVVCDYRRRFSVQRAITDVLFGWF